MAKNIKSCEYFSNAFHIPSYLYENGRLTAAYPEQKNFTYPISIYHTLLWEAKKPAVIVHTTFGAYYAGIRALDSTEKIILGPIGNTAYTPSLLARMRKEYRVLEQNAQEFDSFFLHLPTMDIRSFCNAVQLLHYSVNHLEQSPEDLLLQPTDLAFHQSIHSKYQQTLFFLKEQDAPMDVRATELALMRFIEDGNLEGLREYFNNPIDFNVGVLSEDDVRQAKNEFIVAVTLATRAAIKGGLFANIAYQLSDIYIQKVEAMSSIDTIAPYAYHMLCDFTSRTAETKKPDNIDAKLYQAIVFIKNNTHKRISVDDIARQIGYNRSYLSKKFKKEMGIDISEYMLECKLDEAKEMLCTTEYTISEISNYLCFSSQSHFQNIFKKKMGVTPRVYRLQNGECEGTTR